MQQDMTGDTVAVRRLLAEYCHRVDRGTPAEVADLFAADGILRPRFDGPYEVIGRVDIERWYAHYAQQLKAVIRHLRHHIGSEWIRIRGDAADSDCYFVATYIANEGSQAFFVTGSYRDTAVRTPAGWRFRTREIEVGYAAPLAGAIETFPSLGWPGAGGS